jgi:hypothetical protein
VISVVINLEWFSALRGGDRIGWTPQLESGSLARSLTIMVSAGI